MPMISGRPANKYPLPKEGELKGFFYHRVDEAGRSGVFVNVYAPAKVRIRFQSKVMDEPRQFMLGIPWHIFGAFLDFGAGISLHNAVLLFMNRKPEGMDDIPCINALPNSFESGRLCYGKRRPWAKSKVPAYMKALYRNYWLGTFTSDLVATGDSLPAQLCSKPDYSDGISVFTKHALRYLGEWERATSRGEEIQWVTRYDRRSLGSLFENRYNF